MLTIVPLSKNILATKMAFANKPPVFPLKSSISPLVSFVFSNAVRNSVGVDVAIKLDICMYPISFFTEDLTDSIFIDFLLTDFIIFLFL